MGTHQNIFTLWLLLLLLVSGSAVKWNLFRLQTGRKPGVQEGDVRLFGSDSASEGRVEVYHEGEWGTVCDDGWDMAEAQVVCRQLKFPGAKSVVIGKDYGKASGPIWLDDMKCKGTEDRLSTCDFKNWGVTDCSHKEDVGIICATDETNVTTLVDSTHSLDHSVSLSDDLGKIFDSGDDCDFLIFVQSETGKTEEDGSPEIAETQICTHKMILSQFPLFNASNGNTSITVSVSPSCKPHFTSFIRYLYTRKMDVSFSSVQCFHWMASKFGVRQLMEETGRLFTKILPEDASFDSQTSLYKYAVETGDLVLQENCIQYLAWNFQNLTRSPAWINLSVKTLRALLSRSDLVVPDEYFVLQALESWITDNGKPASSETQADLLSFIRFPMISAEQLYKLEFNSSLYNTHKNIYRENMLKAYQLNFLLFSKLKSNPKFNKDDDGYHPRIYIAEPWSTFIDPVKQVQSYTAPTFRLSSYNRHRYNGYGSYGNYGRFDNYEPTDPPPPPTISPYLTTITESFSTPFHNSLIFKDNKIEWEANVLRSEQGCSSKGLTCESFPLANLKWKSHQAQKNVIFRNQLLVMCQGKYICQVQDFKENLAHVTVNGTHVVTYPCPDDKYTYRFVVRPDYA